MVNTIKHRVNIDRFPLEERERIVKVDLMGTYLVSKAVVPAMIRQPGQQGCCPTAGRAHRQDCLDPGSCARSLAVRVTAAEAGVVQLTRALAIELAEFGILVNCVAPASTLTEGTKQLFYSENATEKERARRMLSHVPVGRPGSVEEIAHAVLFFAAPESTYITGQTLCVDGGWTAGGYLRDF
jgi:NAD(P)-dependent dehydrogenase (short-subunit alcohol dehydrogenase family)